MEIKRKAIAGTLESSDVMVTIEPRANNLDVDIASPVLSQYGESIRETVKEVLQAHDIKEGRVHLEDHGALDCTIRARVESCLQRACQEEGESHA